MMAVTGIHETYWKKERDGRRRAKPRQNPDKGSHENANETEENIHRREENLGAQQNMT